MPLRRPQGCAAWLVAAAILLLVAGTAREAHAGGPPPVVGCACCACDFGGGDVECGSGDVDCLECEDLGGVPAADCSVCAGEEGCAGDTLCDGDPNECDAGPSATGCGCCACDFGDDGAECGSEDPDCRRCIALGGQPAADCSACADAIGCENNTLCGANPQCQAPTQTPTETPTATPVPGGGACTQTSECGPGFECVGNVCTAIPAGAPPTSPAGLLAALAAMTVAAALALRRRAR